MRWSRVEISRGINENNNEFLEFLWGVKQQKKSWCVVYLLTGEVLALDGDKRWMTEWVERRELLLREGKLFIRLLLLNCHPIRGFCDSHWIEYNIWRLCVLFPFPTSKTQNSELGLYLSFSFTIRWCREVETVNVDDDSGKKTLKLTRNYESNTSSKVEDFVPLWTNGQYEEQITYQ